MKRITITLMMLTLASQLLGFGREITLSYFYGASNVSDAYLVSLLIPGLIIGIIASGASSAYIPTYNSVTVESGGMSGDIFTSQVINILILICLLLVLVSNFFIEDVISIFAYGFDQETLSLTKSFTRVTLLAMFFIGLTPILSGYLHNNKNYIIPALLGIPLNIIIIISILLSSTIDINILPFGFLLANFFSISLMSSFLAKNRFSYKRSLGLKDPKIKELLILSIPVILGASFNQINILIDRTIASGVSVGGITSLHYANRITLSIDAIITVSFMVIFFPVMSKLIAEKKHTEFNNNVKNYLQWILLLIIPSSMVLTLYSTEIITILFGRGAFDSRAVKMTSGAIFFYSFGMAGIALSTILSKTCYALKNTSLPIKTLLLGIAINISLSLLLSTYMGINGLALGTSIAAMISSIVLFSLMKNKYRFLFDDFSLVLLLFKIFFASFLSGYIGRELPEIMGVSNGIYSFTISMAVNITIYLFAVHITHIIDIKNIFYKSLKFYSQSNRKL